MAQNSKPYRKRLRLDTWDYSDPGAYFLTVCTDRRQALINKADIRMMIAFWWKRIGQRFENTEIDEFIVMPDHLHGIIMILDDVSGPTHEPVPTHEDVDSTGVGAHPRVRPDVVEMMCWFKTMTTNEYIRGVREKGWDGFSGKLWQRGYYDRIIRDEEELSRIRSYIRDNPERLAGS